MNVPPQLPPSSHPLASAGKWFAVAATALVVIGVGRNVWSEARRGDTPERYAQMCGLLLAALPAETTAPSPRATSAEEAVRLQHRRQELDDLAQQCRQLAPIARDAARELAALEQLSKSQPPLSKLILSGAEMAVGFGLTSTGMIESGSKGVLQELKGYAEIWDALKATRERIDIARVRLVEALPTYAGPEAKDPLIEGEFTEEEPSILGRVLGNGHSTDGIQTLRLKNVSGQALSQCVIKVRLVRPSGESFLHLYHVEAWPNGERRRICYAPHELFAGTDRDIRHVQVSLAAREKTSPEFKVSRAGEVWPYTK